MEQFSEEHGKLLLNKEWLVATKDSTPYLFKCYFSTADLSCFILVTDTKTVWTEVLNSKQFARRWRACNPNSAVDDVREDDEEQWRIANLELLARAHTLGGIVELSFDCVESKYADLAIELECETFKWRWETCLQGRRLSAEIISSHLVLPLISLNHLAFMSPVGESSESDLEKAVDKLGRTARRSVDTHVKNALAKPRLATSLRRITAMFNFVPDLPPIMLTVEQPDLQAQVAQGKTQELSPVSTHRRPSKDPMVPATPPSVTSASFSKARDSSPKIPVTADSNSATESDSEGEASPAIGVKGKGRAPSSAASPPADVEPQSPAPRVLSIEPTPSKPHRRPSSDSESSPLRPVKKTRPPLTSSEEEDSEAERKRRLAKLKSGGAGGANRGTKQPIKRGGRRF